MKNLITLLLLCIATPSIVTAQNDRLDSFTKIQQTEKDKNNFSSTVDAKILEFYCKYSFYTDPGEYVTMYENLPDSLADICKLIKAQLIHPMADLPQYRDLIPPERSYEDLKYPTVKTILAGLKSYNPDGLIFDRKPEDRLVVTCRYDAILLASILKHRGIPARVRYGFATYLYPGYNIYHVVCEVWDKKENNWILVDPDRQIIGLTSQQFEFACDAWEKLRSGKLNSETYGVPDWWGSHPILDVLCHDLASVLGNEHIYYDRPPISSDTTMNVKNMPDDQLTLIDDISELMENVDGNFYELQLFYDKNKILQVNDRYRKDE